MVLLVFVVGGGALVLDVVVPLSCVYSMPFVAANDCACAWDTLCTRTFRHHVDMVTILQRFVRLRWWHFVDCPSALH